MSLPPDHSQRFILTNEVHARPYEALTAPARASYVAVMVAPEDKAREYAHLGALCARHGVHPPPADAIYASLELGALRLRWERHTEFSSYTFLASGANGTPFAEPAASLVPPEWLAAIPGRTVVAAHVELRCRGEPLPPPTDIADCFDGNYVVGAEIGEGAALAFTDFRVHADGCSRFLLFDRSLSRYQAGRMVQRLVEIETYRVMALLALPIAREVSPRLLRIEHELAHVTSTIAGQDEADEPTLLDLVTRLAAEIESVVAATQYRFGAARAYHDIVRSRIAELRERRLPGTQTIAEFMGRRVAPAMATCESVAQRQNDLSERVARASRLLSTRVDIVRERQNQELLASMNRRARLQLRLQETVEGLSVAAITYYVVGLVGYAAKGLKAGGAALNVDVIMGASIPVVAVLAALGIRYVRRSVVRRHDLSAP